MSQGSRISSDIGAADVAFRGIFRPPLIFAVHVKLDDRISVFHPLVGQCLIFIDTCIADVLVDPFQ